MSNILWLCVAIVAVFAGILIVAVTFASKIEKRVYAEGVEVEGVVVRNVYHFSADHASRYTCYVRYRGNDGNDHEGALNISTDLPIGRKVKVKYLPEKYENVVFVSQVVEEREKVC